MRRWRRRREEEPQTVASLAQALQQQRDEAARLRAVEAQCEAEVEELGELEAAVALGEVEPAVAQQARADAHDALRSAREQRARSEGAAAALERRLVDRAEHDVQRVKTAGAKALEGVNVEVAEAQQALREAVARHDRLAAMIQAAAEQAQRTLEAVDPERRRAAVASRRQETEVVLSHARNPGAMDAVIPPHLRDQVMAARQRLQQEARDGQAEAVRRNREQLRELGIGTAGVDEPVVSPGKAWERLEAS